MCHSKPLISDDSSHSFTSMISSLNENTYEELVALFQSDLSGNEQAQEEGEAVWLSEVAHKIMSFGRPGFDFLKSQLPGADEIKTEAILSSMWLAKNNQAELYVIIRQYLQDDRPSILAQAIDNATFLGYRDLYEQILSCKDHSSPYVVGAVLRYLSRLYPDLAKPFLLQALHSDDHIIIQNGIDELDDLQETEALAAIRLLLNHQHPHVRQAAQSAVENLERC